MRKMLAAAAGFSSCLQPISLQPIALPCLERHEYEYVFTARGLRRPVDSFRCMKIITITITIAELRHPTYRRPLGHTIKNAFAGGAYLY